MKFRSIIKTNTTEGYLCKHYIITDTTNHIMFKRTFILSKEEPSRYDTIVKVCNGFNLICREDAIKFSTLQSILAIIEDSYRQSNEKNTTK